LLGIVGVLLAVPLAAACRVILFAAVFPAIQGKSRAAIESGCPGVPKDPALAPPLRPAPAKAAIAEVATGGSSAAPSTTARRKKRRKDAGTPA